MLCGIVCEIIAAIGPQNTIAFLNTDRIVCDRIAVKCNLIVIIVVIVINITVNRMNGIRVDHRIGVHLSISGGVDAGVAGRRPRVPPKGRRLREVVLIMQLSAFFEQFRKTHVSSGGGTAGQVSPLVVQVCRHHELTDIAIALQKNPKLSVLHKLGVIFAPEECNHEFSGQTDRQTGNE
jgi:hypothetical protein